MVKRVLNLRLEVAWHLAHDRHVMIGTRFEAAGLRFLLQRESEDPGWGVLVTTFVAWLSLGRVWL